jgi:hypothetical protein
MIWPRNADFQRTDKPNMLADQDFSEFLVIFETMGRDRSDIGQLQTNSSNGFRQSEVPGPSLSGTKFALSVN